jgi:hypothetical protein
VEAPPLDLAPAGTSTADRLVAVSSGGTTSTYGGTGGTRYPDDCGAGAVLVGYQGWKTFYLDSTTEQYLIGLQAVCGRLRVPAGTTAVETVSDVMLSVRGRAEAQAWQAMCPGGQALVGFTAHLDAGTVENLQFRCAPLAVAAAPPGAMTVGVATALPWSGQRTSGPDVTTTCPAGQVGRGHIARVGSFIDAYQMVCGTPSVAP